MLKITASVLAAAVLVVAVGVPTADAAKKKRKERAKEYTAANCTASPVMRDESRFANCWPNQKK